MAHDNTRDAPVGLNAEDCNLDDFRSHVDRQTDPDTVPLAAEIADNIPLYDGGAIRHGTIAPRDLMAEWSAVFATGPGIIVVKHTYDDLALIDDVTDVLNAIIDNEQASGAGSGDHFAAAGANSRIWNSHEKLCIANPELFARYNANPVIDLASQAWLGPLYQVTMQVNVVRPGGQAQNCHRDYHMGFQTPQMLAEYPAHIHAMSAMLTLQGAIAHCDMPVASGPTKLLPFSQTYLPGYLAAQRPEFRDCFEETHVQLPLEKGDTLFFNPAVFHAAGENKTTDIDRIVNLMQVGSGYGRSIEILDRARMSAALFPTLKDMAQTATLSESELRRVIASCAEGYPFPANLDIDSPLTGMAPDSQQQLMTRALFENWETADFLTALHAQSDRKRSH